MKFCRLILELLLHKIFVTHIQTDTHFPEIVKSCSGHPKTFKSIKNRKSKIFTKPMLSSIYVEESKKLGCPNMVFILLCDIKTYLLTIVVSFNLLKSHYQKLTKTGWSSKWNMWISIKKIILQDKKPIL